MEKINRRFLYFKRNAAFEQALAEDAINYDSIVFVENPGFIWTHGHKFAYCQCGSNTENNSEQNKWVFGDKFPIILGGGEINTDDLGWEFGKPLPIVFEGENNNEGNSWEFGNMLPIIFDDGSSNNTNCNANLVTLTTQEYQNLVDSNLVRSDTYYFTYNSDVIKWVFGGKFPITLK